MLILCLNDEFSFERFNLLSLNIFYINSLLQMPKILGTLNIFNKLVDGNVFFSNTLMIIL